MKVLFVCSGNICRSPMAAEYMRHRAAQAGLSHVVVDSAGTLGIEGAPASSHAVATLRRIGLDLRGHSSRGLRSSDLRTADLVIVMGPDHLETIASRFPNHSSTVLLLRAFEHGPDPTAKASELDDPIGQSPEFYERQFEIVKNCVDHLVMHLRHDPT